jgi:hypothetical protein
MTRIQQTTRELIAVAATCFALGCDDGDGGPSANTGTIGVTLNPTALSIPQGGNATVTATLERRGGFAGAVTLAMSGLATGITTTITPTQLSGTLTTATITINVAATVAPQAYTGTLTATGSEGAQAAATYQLTVAAAPNYALSVSPAAITIPAGTTGGVTVNIDRTNFPDAISLELAEPPAGITGVFSPAPATTNASSLVLTVPATVPAGNHSLTIRGTATGPGIRTATLALSVVVPPAGGTRIEYRFCDASAAPVFFAYQDGVGIWQRVVGEPAGDVVKFAFEIRQGRGGVMAVYQTAAGSAADALGLRRRSEGVRRTTTARAARMRGSMEERGGVAGHRLAQRAPSVVDTYQTDVWYASVAELAEDATAGCEVEEPTKTVTGTVAGVTTGQYGILSLGAVTEVFDGRTSTNPVTFTDVAAGRLDFVATRMPTPGTPPDKAVIMRNLDIADGGSLPATVDFNGAAAITPVSATASISGGGGTDRLEIFTELVTANGASLFWFDLSPSVVATRPWAGIAPAAMVSGDYHALVVFATPPASQGNFRVSLKYVGPVANQTLTLGPTIAVPTVSSVAAGAYPRFRFQGSVPLEYDRGMSIFLSSSANGFGLLATSAYLTASGNARAYDLTMPDVASLPGFPVAARLTTGANDLSANAFGFTGPGLFDVRPNVGAEFKGATVGATLTVP